ncbi:FAFL036Cp [Eremothecium gossypii FDAG1]|nr:FAFL036Cp [Eremothecium gossypii FDAG1]
MPATWTPEEHIPAEIKALLAEPSPNYVLTFLHIVELLKTQRRTGWVDHGILPCESISDHMYRMGITSMLIKDPAVDRNRCVRIALVHDLAESLVGDITPVAEVTKEEKHRREWETIQYLCQQLIAPYNPVAADEIMRDWLAYENTDCLEARYTKDIDKFEMLVQCFEYERRHGGTKNLQQFWSAVDSIKTDEVRSWVQDLQARRNRFFESFAH